MTRTDKILITLTALILIGLSLVAFTNKAHAAAYPVGVGGTGQTTFTSSNLLYGNLTNALSSVATTSATCAGTVTCTTHTVIGASPVTITGTGSTFSYPFTTITNWGTTTAATTTALQAPAFFASSTLASQFPYASTTALTISGTAYIGSLTGYLKGTSGTVSAQTVPIPIADGGTNATSYTLSNGIVAYDGTRLVNFTGYTLTSTGVILTNASTTNLTASQSFGVAGNKIPPSFYPAVSVATSTAWAGTTTVVSLGIATIAETWDSIQCTTDAGTLNLQFVNAASNLNMVTASTTVGTQPFTTNNSLAVGAKRTLTIGTPASSPTYVGCTITKHYTF